MLSKPSASRGIALKGRAYKVLAWMVAKRVMMLAEEAEYIPEDQHGFVSGKSARMALEQLLNDLDSAWTRSDAGQSAQAVFVDFRSAFNSASWRYILSIPGSHGTGPKLLRQIKEILKGDKIVILDGDRAMGTLTQTPGVTQGELCSSFCCWQNSQEL